MAYRIKNTITGRELAGPSLKTPRGAIATIVRYMEQHPEGDPVVIDLETDLPLSIHTLSSRIYRYE
jgi:hypothetical protein